MMLMPGRRPPPMRNRWRTGSIAASVLPVAVGEMRRTFFPARMWWMIRCWGSVGLVNPLSSTSLRTGRQSREKAFFSVNSAKLENTAESAHKNHIQLRLWVQHLR